MQLNTSFPKAAENSKTSLVSIWNMPATALQGNQLDTTLKITSGDGYEKGFAVLQIITEPTQFIIPNMPMKLKGFFYIVPSGDKPIEYGRIEFTRHM